VFVQEKVRTSSAWLQRKGVPRAGTGLSLEAGMDGFTGELSGLRAVRAAAVPNFAKPRERARRERILSGYLGDQVVLVHEGRGYLYEGYFHRELAFPIRLFAAMGVRRMLFAVGLVPLAPAGEDRRVVLVEDHLDLTAGSPLRGAVDAGERPEPDPSLNCSGGLREKAERLAGVHGLKHETGVLAMLPGPLDPTPAERRMLTALGAGYYAFSPAAEIAVARSLGLETVIVGLTGSRAGWGEGSRTLIRDLFAEAATPPAAEVR
jgi:purine-nucleoside phosphorylase